jgi:hypothetical protein
MDIGDDDIGFENDNDFDVARRRLLARAVPAGSPGGVNSSPIYRPLINVNPSPIYPDPRLVNLPQISGGPPKAQKVLDFVGDDQIVVDDLRDVSNSTAGEDLIFGEVGDGGGGGGGENLQQADAPDPKKPVLTKQSSLQDVKNKYTVNQFRTYKRDAAANINKFHEGLRVIMPRQSEYELARYTFEVSRLLDSKKADRKELGASIKASGDEVIPAAESAAIFYTLVRDAFLGSGDISRGFKAVTVASDHYYVIHDGPVFSYIWRKSANGPYSANIFDFEKYGAPEEKLKLIDLVTYELNNDQTHGCYYVSGEKSLSSTDKRFITAALQENFGNTDRYSFLVTKKSYNAHSGNGAVLRFSIDGKTRCISVARKKGTRFVAHALQTFEASRVDFDLNDGTHFTDPGVLFPFFLADNYKLSVSAAKPYTLTCTTFEEYMGLFIDKDISQIDIDIEAIMKAKGLDGSRIHAITAIGNLAILATSRDGRVCLIACDTVYVDAAQPAYKPPTVHETSIMLDDPAGTEIPLVQMFMNAHTLCIATHASLYYYDMLALLVEPKKSRGKLMPAVKPKDAAAEDTPFTELAEKNHMNSVRTIVARDGPAHGLSRDETVSLIFAIAEAKRAAALKTSEPLKNWRILEADFVRGLSLLFAVNGLKFDKKKEEKTDLVVSVRNNGEHVVSTGYEEGNQKFVHRVIEKSRVTRYSTFIFTDPQSEYKCLVRSPATTSASKLRETFTNNAVAEIVKIRTGGNPSLGLPTLMRDGDSDDLVHAVVFMPNEETDDIQLVVEIVSADSRQKAVCLLLRQEKSGAATVLMNAVRETSNIARGDIGVDYNVQRMAYRTVDASGQSEELRVKIRDTGDDVLYDLADNSRILFSMSDVLLVAARLDPPFNVGYWLGESSSKNQSNLFSGDEYTTKKLLAIAHYGFTVAAIFRQGRDYFLGAGDLLDLKKESLVKLDKFNVKDDDYSDRALLSFGARKIVAVVGKGPAWEIDVMKAVFPPTLPPPPPHAPPAEAVPTTAVARKGAQKNDDIVSKTSVNFIPGAAIRDFEVEIANDGSVINVKLPDDQSAAVFSSKNAILVTDVSEYNEFLKSFEFELDRAAGERIVTVAAYSSYRGEDVEDEGDEDEEEDDERDDDKDEEDLPDVDVKFRESEIIDTSFLDGALGAKNNEEEAVKELEEKLKKSTNEGDYSNIMDQLNVMQSDLIKVSAERQRALDAGGLILDEDAPVYEKGYENVESEAFKELDARTKELKKQIKKISGALNESRPYIHSQLVIRKKSLANTTIAYTKIKHLFDVREQLYEIYDRLSDELLREHVGKKISELEEEIYFPATEREFRNVSANFIGSDSQGATIEVFREQQKQTVVFLAGIYDKRNEVISGINKKRSDLNKARSKPEKYSISYFNESENYILKSEKVLAEVNGELKKKLDEKSDYWRVLQLVFEDERKWLAAHPSSEIAQVGDDGVVTELNTILDAFKIPRLNRKLTGASSK